MSVSGVIHEGKIPVWLRVNIGKMVKWPVVLYGAEALVFRMQEERLLQKTEN